MRRIGKTIVDALKIAAGRKLSAKQLGRAATEQKIEGNYMCISPENYGGDFDNIYKNGQKIARNRINYVLATTQDFSHREVSHTNYYPVRYTDTEYDLNGLLVRKRVLTREPASFSTSEIEVAYNPPGSFWGTTIKSRRW